MEYSAAILRRAISALVYIGDMGALSPKLFDDDRAADVRGTYRSYIEQGVDDGEALRRILERYQRWFDREDGLGALVGFAVTQSDFVALIPRPVIKRSPLSIVVGTSNAGRETVHISSTSDGQFCLRRAHD
jgi:hypothetical protein